MANSNNTRSVKLSAEIVDLVEKNKERTGIPVKSFFEQAATDRLNNPIASGKEANFIKNTVYKIGGEKRLCLLIDEQYAVLCKLILHRNDTGYNIKFIDIDIYTSLAFDVEKEMIGVVDGINFIPKK